MVVKIFILRIRFPVVKIFILRIRFPFYFIAE